MKIYLILNNIRSTYNVGSILRTAEGFGVDMVIFCGYTPHPKVSEDSRPPHVIEKNTRMIEKTALGAEKIMQFEYHSDVKYLIRKLKKDDFSILALEQSSESTPLQKFRQQKDTAIILGEELNGIDLNLLSMCDAILEIPMMGKKESFNVSVACGIALYQLRLIS